MLIVSTGIRCSLAIVGIFACAVSGQFTFTGFPTALKDSRHTITCSYPGATSYTWRFRGGTYNGAAYTFITDVFDHEGVWECDAVVNGVAKTGKINLLIYCDGVYVTGATATNPSIGDPIELSCNVIIPSGNMVQWLLNIPGSDVKAIAAVTRSRCEYYHAENDNIKFAPSTTCATSTTNHFFMLNIKKVSSTHAGYWMCHDFGKRGCYSKPVRIAIAKPPKDPPTLTGFNNPNPIVGHDHNLTCDAWQPDVRPLTYTWYKDGVQVSSGNTSTWRLQPVKRESAGRYKCEGVDKVKNLKVEAEDTLIVYYVATWNPAVVYEAETLAVIGGSVNFTLAILVYPLPTSIELYKVKGNTVTSVKYVITKLSDIKWILTIHSVREEDYGFYKANVTNAAGRAIFTFNLTRPHIPDAPSNLNIRVMGTYDVIVTFTSGSDGGAPQTFTIEYNVLDRHPQVIQGIEDPKNRRTVTYTIRHLLAGTTYYMKVKAVNEVGVSKFTETAKIKTSDIPDAPSNLKIRVTGTNDGIVTFTSGSDGGAPQTFTIEYNINDRHPQVIRGIENPKNTRTVTYTIRHLLAGTTYYIKVKAVNEVGVSKFTETAKIKTSGIALSAGEIAGAVVSVILFVVLMAVVIVVVMQRRNVTCCAGQADTRAPALSLAVANSVGGDAANVTNPAFEGETEPVYVNQPPPGRGPTEPEYVNQPRQIRAPDSVVYEDMSTPYNPYEGLNMTARAEEDQQYESLKIENTKV